MDHWSTVLQCSSKVGKRAGCKRNWAQSSVRTTEIRAQFSAQTTQNLLRVNDQYLVVWAIDVSDVSWPLNEERDRTYGLLCRQTETFGPSVGVSELMTCVEERTIGPCTGTLGPSVCVSVS